MSYKFELAEHFAKCHPQTSARVLEEVPPEVSMEFIQAMPLQHGARLLASMLPYPAAKCIARLPENVAARYLSELEIRTITRILHHVAKEKREQILGRLPWRIAARVSLILNYSQATVGAWIEPAVLTLPLDGTTGKARERLSDEGYPDCDRIYVVNEIHHLKGTIPLISLIQATDEDLLLDRILKPVTHILKASATLEMAVNNPGWQNHDYLPVIDRQERFLGVLRHATLLSVLAGPRAKRTEQGSSETLLDIAETCYLGLANILSTSLSVKNPMTEKGGR